MFDSSQVQALGKEVCQDELGRHKRHNNLEGIDHIANIEVTTRGVLGLVVVLGVVREVARTCVVSGERRGARHGRRIEAAHELVVEDDIFGRLRHSDNLSLSGG